MQQKVLGLFLLTTLTTSAGLLPLAYGIGGQDPTTAPMALGWGLFIATPLILFILPVLYAMSLQLNNMVFKPKVLYP